MSISKTDLARIKKTFEQARLPYVKVELEAQFNREHPESVQCCGPCRLCGGNGAIINGRGMQIERCPDCNGLGRRACGQDHSIATILANTELTDSYIRSQMRERFGNKIIFSKFYRDGSCDSELTFTIKVAHIEIIPEVVKLFRDIRETTGVCDVRGAGVHIALMPTKLYPASTRLDRERLDNFQFNVERLLPALYFLGSGPQSRSLQMRQPRIRRGTDRHGDKYSAIYTRGDTVIEYRIFETCYDHPERMMDYLAVIANTLDYYNDPTKVAPVYNHVFEFREGNSLQRFYQDKKSLQVLEKQIPLLKPWWKSVEQLKKERRFPEDIKKLELKLALREQRLQQEFERTYDKDELPKGYQLVKYIQSQYSSAGLMVDKKILAIKAIKNPKKTLYEAFKASRVRETKYTLEV